LETIGSHKSILLETLFYIYGARFISYLAIKYSSDDVIRWVRAEPSESYQGILAKFEDIFKVDFNKAWQNFINYEITFQNSNIDLIKQNELTNLKRISGETFGWVTQPYFDRFSNEVLFGYHRSHELAELQSFKLTNGKSTLLSSLPTPSMIQVASTAFDEGAGLYFFTTNNNQLFRDIWAIDVNSGDKKLLFENCRVGDLTISPIKRDLWGVRVQSGIKTLVISPYPYNELIPVFSFDVSEDIFQLSIDTKGEKLAAVLHKANGLQSIIVADANKLINSEKFEYVTISNNGSPENPSWSFDGNFLYWNAFTNGVSNIYRFDINNNSVKAITNCVTGLFKPIEISEDSLFAFEYSTDGFTPVMFLNKPAEYLAAINYLGQNIIEKNPEVVQWVLPDASTVINPMEY
ncbi:MAG: hypothetical protein R3321_12170, partial [Nitrososphaeraceae archaeon]|nr:hypothetical protein [Nitrososphaeraceae archaeon]